MNDVVVVVKRDTAPRPAEVLGILIVLTDRKREPVTYTSLDTAAEGLGKESNGYRKVEALFGQGTAAPTPDKLIQRVDVVGFADIESPESLIAAIRDYQAVNDDWYILLTDRYEEDYIKALAEYACKSEPSEAELNSGAEDHRKFYFAQTSQKDLEVPFSRSAVIYTDNLDGHADAAWVGAVGPWYPAYVTWKFKMPAGLDCPALTQNEMNGLEKNHINFVTNEYKRCYVKNGTCTDGEWIDTVIGGDWIAEEIRRKIYDVFLKNPIVPYTDAGFILIGAAVLQAMDAAVKNGIIAEDQGTRSGIYTVNIPKWEDATETQRRNRQIPDITWEAQLTGAVHSAKIKGALSVGL